MSFRMNSIFAWMILAAIFISSGCGTSSTVMIGTALPETEVQATSNQAQGTPLESSIPLTTTQFSPANTTSDTTTETTLGTASETTFVTTPESTNAASDPTIIDSTKANPETIYSIIRKRDVLVLMAAYPEKIVGVEFEDGKAFLQMKSGNRLLYDDEKKKSFDEKIDHADIQDMLEQVYPLTDIEKLMDTNNDPGRFRVYPLLNELYGASKTAVSANLTTVGFGDQKLPFNKSAGAAAAFQTVAGQLDALVERQPQTAEFIYPSSGTFNYRTISGTDRLSPHAYAIAVDLKSHENDYWLWADFSAGSERLREYPDELVRIFEENGFIWGGKWNHFDLLHYEYRPEIILKAKYFPEEPELDKPWYEGADLNNERVKNSIEFINRNLP